MAQSKRLIFNKYDNSFPQPFEIYVKKKFIVTDKMGNIFGLFFSPWRNHGYRAPQQRRNVFLQCIVIQSNNTCIVISQWQDWTFKRTSITFEAVKKLGSYWNGFLAFLTLYLPRISFCSVVSRKFTHSPHRWGRLHDEPKKRSAKETYWLWLSWAFYFLNGSLPS